MAQHEKFYLNGTWQLKKADETLLCPVEIPGSVLSGLTEHGLLEDPFYRMNEPTPERPGCTIGAAGPTTSGRMDSYTPRLLDLGLACMIGKGVRNQGVQDAMARNGAVYMVAIGGAGAAKAASIKNVEVIAYDELGCESVKRLTVENFSAIVSQDSVGGNLYTEGVAKYKKD